MPNPVYAYILDKYDLLLTIQLNISHLFLQLNDQAVLFQTIQFGESHLFALSLNVK